MICGPRPSQVVVYDHIRFRGSDKPDFGFEIAGDSDAVATDVEAVFFDAATNADRRYKRAGVNRSPADGWVTLSAPMVRSWTDAEAVANGWKIAGGATPTSFVDTSGNLRDF